MGRRKQKPFVLDPETTINCLNLKKVNIDNFRQEITKYAQSILTDSEYRMFVRSEEVLSKIHNKKEKMEDGDGTMIVEAAKVKAKKFSIHTRRTIENYLEQHKLKTLY